jgi:hypothetical protein
MHCRCRSFRSDLLGGYATRPISPPITQVDLGQGYRYETHQARSPGSDSEDLVILPFSGGGTRAAAFSYGVLVEHLEWHGASRGVFEKPLTFPKGQ